MLILSKGGLIFAFAAYVIENKAIKQIKLNFSFKK